MASYPTSAFNPATRSANQTIASAHMNDVQAEITAIENALLSTGIAHDLKFVDASHDIGNSGAFRPRDLFLSRNAVIGGTLAVTGVATFTAAPVFSAGLGTLAGLTLSAGIAFPATQVPSADVNTLDDYEEGTVTFTDASGAGLSIAQTGTGRYVKIGRLVTVWGYLTYPSTADASAAVLGGLPFTAALTFGGGIPHWTSEANLALMVNASATTINLHVLGNTTQKTNANMSTDAFRFVLVYEAAA